MWEGQCLGRAAPPAHPALRLWAGSGVQHTDGKLRHGEGGDYSALVPAVPVPSMLVLPECPSLRRVPQPDSHPHGHDRLSASFQAGAGVSAGDGGEDHVPRCQAPQEGLGYTAVKSIPVRAAGCQAALRPA